MYYLELEQIVKGSYAILIFCNKQKKTLSADFKNVILKPVKSVLIKF